MGWGDRTLQSSAKDHCSNNRINMNEIMLTRTIIILIFTSLGIIFVEPQAFQVVPSNTCVPCGGSTEFNCTTTMPINLGGGRIVEEVSGQMWRIQTPDGTVTNLRSNIPDMVPADYEFISPFLDDFTGLRVLNTNSTWNGTTFQCIAFDPSNVERQNSSARAVTLEVGGPPQSFTCELQCPDTYRSGTSDQCTIMWERLPTVSCSSLQVSASLRQSDGTLVYSDVFSPNVTSTETAPLSQNTVYTVTITAENLCGSSTCSTTTSTAVEAPATFNVTARVVFPSTTLEQINITWTPPGPGDPLVDSYTVNVSSTDGQRLCGSQTTAGNVTSAVLDVTGCVMCQGSNKSYTITVKASNRGGRTTAITSLSNSYIQGYQVHDISADGQCALSISCTVSDRTVATGCVFMYDSNGDGTLDSETFLNLTMSSYTAEGRIIIDCNLNQLNFTIRAVAGTTLATAIPLGCPVSSRVSSSAPVHLQGIAINSTTIELQWEPPPLADQSGMIHSFLINISAAESGSFYQLTSESNALNISGLHPFYTYNLTVAAVLIYPGPYSAVLTIQMPEDVPSSAPVRLQGSAVNSTTIQLQWEPPPLADQNGVIRSYIINISVAETGSSFQRTSETTAFYISNLHPYYTYTLTVAAVTIAPGPYGLALSIQTSEDVPSAPQNLTGEQLNATVVRLHWDPPESPNGIIIGFQVTYYGYRTTVQVQQVQDGMMQVVDGPHIELTLEYSIVLSNLSPGLTYLFKVRARTSVGYGNSTALNITIPAEGETGGCVNSSTIAAVVILLVLPVLVVFIVAGLVFCRRLHKFKEYTVRENTSSNTHELRVTRTGSNNAALENEKKTHFRK